MLAGVAHVPVGVLWGVPSGGLGRLPPFGGELRAAAGAEGTGCLALGLLLLGRVAQLFVVLAVSGFVVGPLAHAVCFAAWVADGWKEGLHVLAAETVEHRPGRAVFAQVAQPGRDDGDLVVAEVVVLVPLPRPQRAGELYQAWDGSGWGCGRRCG